MNRATTITNTTDKSDLDEIIAKVTVNRMPYGDIIADSEINLRRIAGVSRTDDDHEVSNP